ncbi:DUF6541 family protein [Leucobacter salsicius]|uniref:DUF6541 family protein n=1 Tax=Leucobacter salsicius TaxID=664638 RepID=UPI00036A3DBC|nr:DUF6541 family protein [Leucobacter salsicius]
MAWVSLGIAATAAIGIIALLGAPIAWALRARGFALAVISVAAAFAVVAVSSLIAPVIGVRWSVLVPVAITVVLTLVLVGLRRFILPRIPSRAAHDGTRDLWVGVGAAAIGGAVIAITLAVGIRAGDAVSQTFDAGFHLNAVRYILDSGSASPLDMDMSAPGQSVFYPTLWHAIVVLLVQLTGATIPVATNALLFVVSAVVWPIGAVALGRAVAGPSRAVTVVAGISAAAFPNFPLFLAGYGVLYPNVLSLALMPFLVVSGLLLLNLGPARRALPIAPAGRWLLFFGALGAAALAHPNVVHAVLVWGFVPVVWAAWRALRGRPVPGNSGVLEVPRTPLWGRRLLAVVGLGTLLFVTAAAWIFGRTSDNVWQGYFGPRSALLQLVGGTPHLGGDAWVVSAIILVGAVIVWQRRSMRWLLGSAALLAVFYLMADGFPTSDWRTLFLSPWYNDPRRLAALVPFGALPLLVIGAVSLWAMLRPGIMRLSRQRVSAAFPGGTAHSGRTGRTSSVVRTRRVVTILAVLLLIAAGQSGTYTASQTVRGSYDAAKPRLLSDDERTLLDRLDESVPEGEVIANNPMNGSSLSYALADRAVLFPHAGGSYSQLGYELVRDLVKDPVRACEVSTEIGVNYVLDFGNDYVLDADTQRAVPFKEMKNLKKSPVLSEVDREGDAVLYRVEGC